MLAILMEQHASVLELLMKNKIYLPGLYTILPAVSNPGWIIFTFKGFYMLGFRKLTPKGNTFLDWTIG